VQVVAGTLVTPELVTAMLSSMCDATVTDVVEMMCGPCCTTITCRSGKNKNPHRRRINGVLCPVTFDAAIADVFSVGNTIGPRKAPNPATPALPTPEARGRGVPTCPPSPACRGGKSSHPRTATPPAAARNNTGIQGSRFES
jgi:hypothetical protein